MVLVNLYPADTPGPLGVQVYRQDRKLHAFGGSVGSLLAGRAVEARRMPRGLPHSSSHSYRQRETRMVMSGTGPSELSFQT